MTDNVLDDPEFVAWAKRIQDELVPMIQGSAVSVSLVPTGPSDVKFAVELGLSIMLDKPIIALVQPGTKIPDALRRVAVEIIEYDAGSMEKIQARLGNAIRRYVRG